MEQTPSQSEFKEDLSLQNEEEYPGAAWMAPEYHHTEKTRDWYIGLVIVSATIVIISAIIGNWIFAILVLVATFALALFAHRPPHTIEVEMGVGGIRVEKKVYEYEDLESFWVEVNEHPQHPRILFKSKHTFMPFIVVPLGNMHPDDVAEFLANFLPEAELKETILHRLAEDFGF